uniref:(northern house mosquito) hypothetical protein n=1 Tax=Culex pipiens TaxID=7175 RepID=A0A8D8FTR4_CULPI
MIFFPELPMITIMMAAAAPTRKDHTIHNSHKFPTVSSFDCMALNIETFIIVGRKSLIRLKHTNFKRFSTKNISNQSKVKKTRRSEKIHFRSHRLLRSLRIHKYASLLSSKFHPPP